MRFLPITKFSKISFKQSAFQQRRAGAFLYIVVPSLLFVFASGNFLGADPAYYSKQAVKAPATDESGSTNGDEEDPTYPDPPNPTIGLYTASPVSANIGVLHASGIGFQYWNNYMMMNNIISHLRNVQLATYTGDGTTNGSTVAAPGTEAAYNRVVPADQIGQYQYSTGGYQTAPYGTGYAPAYESGDPRFSTGYPVYEDGMMISPQTNAYTSSVYRGQAAYGDPGTLIYSLWAGVLGGAGTFNDHDTIPGYKTEQKGGFIGLDLFGSCDCRNGLFYSYQDAKIKEINGSYTYPANQSNTLFDPATLIGEGFEKQYSTAYNYDSVMNGLYNGNLNSKNHLIGLYHQFGSEFIFNIATLRFGYSQVKANQTISETGTTNTEVTKTLTDYIDGEMVAIEESSTVTQPYETTVNDSLDSKYDEYLGGINFERGANLKFLNIMTFAPRGALDYTLLYRSKFDETSGGTAYYSYDKKFYNSLRSQLGADLAMDLYPGDGHLRLLVKGSWIHEFLDELCGKTTYVDYLGTSRTVYGNTTGRDWANLGAGVDWAIVPAFAVFLNYDYYKNKYVSVNYGDFGAKLMW